jgi:hypothetical protein
MDVVFDRRPVMRGVVRRPGQGPHATRARPTTPRRDRRHRRTRCDPSWAHNRRAGGADSIDSVIGGFGDHLAQDHETRDLRNTSAYRS